MPRPTVVNAKRQPVPPLNLEELKFWLRIMEEHALFIKAGLPCDNVALISEADSFQQEFAALRARADRVQNQRQFAELVEDTQAVVGDFYHYQRRLLHLVLTCQIAGANFALFLDHVSREAEYFLLLLATMGTGQQLYQVAGAREVTFWLRLLADHSEFVFHRLDPSERTLLEAAEAFGEEFDQLYLQGRDFVSMLRGETAEVPAFRRFLQDVRVSTLRLRDFKRAAETLIAECKLVGLIPALLADHMRREADHFLLVLAILEKGSCAPFDQAGELEYYEMEEGATMAADEETGTIVAAAAPGPLPIEYYDDEDDDDDDRDSVEISAPPSPRPPSPSAPVLSAPPSSPPVSSAPPSTPPAAADPKPAKYKWSGKWPRPLGSVE